MAITLVSLLGYFSMAYLLHRSSFAWLLMLFSMLFGLYVYYLKLAGKQITIQHAFWAGILFRLIFITSIPVLSDDYTRFIWDGQLWVHDINAFIYLPNELIQSGETDHIPLFNTLEQQLNDLQKSNYTCYPPLNQLLFVLPALLFKKSILAQIVFMRVFILVAETGIYFFGVKILKKMKLPVSNIFIYFLNPLVIIELTGNLHFEAIMIFFLVWSVYLLMNNRYKSSAVVFALSASIKLIPLMLLPLFFYRLKGIKGILYVFISMFVFVLLLIPLLLSNGTGGFIQSLNLYFQTFEFNASIFYLLREIGFAARGYDMVSVFGPALAILALLIILLITFSTNTKNENRFMQSMVFILLVYYFMATTVHPWYITTILAVSCFTRLKTPLAWSFAIVLSYHAYQTPTFEENWMYLFAEYLIVFSFLGYDFYQVHSKREEQKHSGVL